MADSKTVYFGYGSNLWKQQMKLRCPTSVYLGIARLDGYRWIINDRGYANVVETKASGGCCWGMVYSLAPSDEAALDINEGVPDPYYKEILDTHFWQCKDEPGAKADISQPPQNVQMLVYIDRIRMTDDTPKPEYVYRMNMGISDAIAAGVPVDYIDNNLRHFIPTSHDKSIEDLARRQATNFVDE